MRNCRYANFVLTLNRPVLRERIVGFAPSIYYAAEYRPLSARDEVGYPAD